MPDWDGSEAAVHQLLTSLREFDYSFAKRLPVICKLGFIANHRRKRRVNVARWTTERSMPIIRCLASVTDRRHFGCCPACVPPQGRAHEESGVSNDRIAEGGQGSKVEGDATSIRNGMQRTSCTIVSTVSTSPASREFKSAGCDETKNK